MATVSLCVFCVGNFEQGVKDAQTYADCISYDMEHAPFDVKGLAD